MGIRDYASTLQQMQSFTESRNADTSDEIWILEHPPVYTQGLNGKPEHILNAGQIPVIKTDRGGQATYHGPGQLIIYPLLDIKRHNIGIRRLVSTLENATIDTLSQYGIKAHSKKEAPGVYTDGGKIASVGLRIKRGCSYHGMSLNVNMDLKPFDGINICGFANLKATQVVDLDGPANSQEIALPLVRHLLDALEYQWDNCEKS